MVTGAGGQVGALLARQAGFRGFDVRALTHADLDITDEKAVRQQIVRDDFVVNCAAFTNVDGAESDPEGAHLLNVVGPGNLAQACADADARLVHLSTDYVFDGKFDGGLPRPYEIDDTTAPLGEYARSKHEGELAIRGTAAAATIVRTSLVYTGGAGSDFIAFMRRCANGAGTVDVVDDLTGSITYVRDLVAALGKRFVVQRASRPEIQSVAMKIGLHISQRAIGKGVARWIPIFGALGAGAYAYYDTIRVADTAIELFAGVIDVHVARENDGQGTPPGERQRQSR